MGALQVCATRAAASFAQIVQQAHAVLGLADLGGQRLELSGIDPAMVERNLLWRRDPRGQATGLVGKVAYPSLTG